MSRNFTIKGIEYVRRSVKQGLPTEITCKGKTYKFGTPLLRVAIEEKGKGRNILCVRIMKTEISFMVKLYYEKPVREVLDEYFYYELDPATIQVNGLTYERNQYWLKVSKRNYW